MTKFTFHYLLICTIIVFSSAPTHADVVDNEAKITKRRLGAGVNTSYAEIMPIVLADGDTLYFTRNNYPDPNFKGYVGKVWDDAADDCRKGKELEAELDKKYPFLKDKPEFREKLKATLKGVNNRDCEKIAKTKDKELKKIETRRFPQQVYVSHRKNDGTWTDSERLPEPFNDPTLQNIGTATISSASPDRNTLLMVGSFLFGTQRIDGCTDFATAIGFSERRCLPIAFVYRTENGWKRVDRIRTEPFKKIAAVGEAAIAPSADTIIFSATEHGGTKGKNSDLWLTRKTDGGLWSAPVKIPILASPVEERAPFIGPDGETLFFSSNRAGGLGGLDLYMAKRLDNSWLAWSEPKNLGEQVNTEEDDSSISIDASGGYAFMSSGKGEQQDIYEFNLPPNLSPAPTALVRGKIKLTGAELIIDDSPGDGAPFDFGKLKKISQGSGEGGFPEGEDDSPATAKISAERLKDGEKAGSANINPKTGEFQLSLAAGEQYAVYVSAPGFAGISKTIDLRKANHRETISIALDLVELKPGATIRLNNIFFDVDKAELLPESEVELRRLTGILNRYKKMKIEIAGHTDSDAADDYNQKLSEDRAGAVEQFLIKQQIATNRLESNGYGETKPVASNTTKEGKQLNRRVEFKILQM